MAAVALTTAAAQPALAGAPGPPQPTQPAPAKPAAATATPAPAPPTAAAKPPAPTPAPAPKPAGQVEVAIGDFSFTPKTLRVPVGTTVVWTNRGNAPHTVTADNNSFVSDTLRNGQSFRHTFTQAGTFPYFCEFHGGPGGVGMTGVVQVGG
jgi:plastocyanin